MNEWWVLFSSQTHLRTGQDSSCILLVFPCARAPGTPSGGQEGPGLCYISPPRSRTVSGLSCDPFPRQNMEKGTAEKLLVQLGWEMLKQKGGSVRQCCSHQLAAPQNLERGCCSRAAPSPRRLWRLPLKRSFRGRGPHFWYVASPSGQTVCTSLYMLILLQLGSQPCLQEHFSWASFKSKLRDTNAWFFLFSLNALIIRIRFNLRRSPVAFYIAPGPVEPAWLVRQGAEELLAGTAWGRKPSYCKLLLFLTCNSLPRWGDALARVFGGAEVCAARTAQEEWHAAMRGTMALGGHGAQLAHSTQGAGAMGRRRLSCCHPMARWPESRATLKPLSSCGCPRKGWVDASKGKTFRAVCNSGIRAIPLSIQLRAPYLLGGD